MDAQTQDRLREIGTELGPKGFIELLEHMINSRESGVRTALVEALPNWHPSLQQGLGRLLVDAIDTLASEEHPDARNEASVNWAKQARHLNPGLFPVV